MHNAHVPTYIGTSPFCSLSHLLLKPKSRYRPKYFNYFIAELWNIVFPYRWTDNRPLLWRSQRLLLDIKFHTMTDYHNSLDKVPKHWMWHSSLNMQICARWYMSLLLQIFFMLSCDDDPFPLTSCWCTC